MSPSPSLLLKVLLLAFTCVLSAQPPLLIVVNAASGVTQMSREEVIRLFTGRQKRLGSGLVALPVEPVGNEELRSRFYQTLMNIPLTQIRSYWARMYFSGQAQPPRQAADSQEVIEIVATNKGAVGFVDQSKLDHRVRCVLVLQDSANH